MATLTTLTTRYGNVDTFLRRRANEIINSGNYLFAVELMDDELREEIAAKMAPCTDREFLVEYMAAHMAKYNEVFTI